MTDKRKDHQLLHDALEFFQSWLCGDGLTSPGVFAENEVLVEELLRLEELKRRTNDALALIARSERIRAALARGLPEDEITTRSAAGSSLLGERDIRRIQSALEAYLEEHNSLDLLIGASGRRVVISTAGDPSQDAELVINR